jgi:hypothetical protein
MAGDHEHGLGAVAEFAADVLQGLLKLVELAAEVTLEPGPWSAAVADEIGRKALG